MVSNLKNKKINLSNNTFAPSMKALHMATISECYSTVSIWDEKLISELLRGIRLSERVFGNYKPEFVNEGGFANENTPLLSLGDLEIATTKTCSVCNVAFVSRQEQVRHFKLDWHCENLKRRDEGLPSLGAESSEKAVQGTGSSTLEAEDTADQNQAESDDSSCSSDNEMETTSTSNSDSVRHAKIYFENAYGDMLSVYKCIILKKKDVPLGEAEVIDRFNRLPSATTWAVFLLGGGHFAGGIFKENEVIAHKTFHRYVTRAKQGSVQSIHDQQRKHAKSAGAQLRRHNELALTEEIQTLCQTWSGLLEECTHIFYRATGNNKRVLFGGKSPLFQKDDGRLRSIPFPTKQSTHQEVVRAHGKLSAIETYGSASEWKGKIPQPSAIPVSPKKRMLNKQKLNPADTSSEQTKEKNHREEKVRQGAPNSDQAQNDGRVPQIRETSASKMRQETPQLSRDSSIDSNNEDLILNVQEELFSTSELREFEVVFSKNEVHVPVAKDTTSSKQQLSPIFDKEEQRLRNALYTACRVDDSESLQRLLSPLKPGSVENCNNAKLDTLLQMLNSAFGNAGFTLLHICARHGYQTLIWMLLECGADPAIGDKRGQPAYTFAVNKETRNTFRRFMASFPEKYGYVAAQIPSPLSEEAEKTKLIKLQQKRQQRKQKTKALKLEQEEKAKFLNSTDTEKKIHSKTLRGALRCFFCGDSLVNKVPFSYDEYKFCTLRCLQQHRRR